jgi:hypothetical protein
LIYSRFNINLYISSFPRVSNSLFIAKILLKKNQKIKIKLKVILEKGEIIDREIYISYKQAEEAATN